MAARQQPHQLHETGKYQPQLHESCISQPRQLHETGKYQPQLQESGKYFVSLINYK